MDKEIRDAMKNVMSGTFTRSNLETLSFLAKRYLEVGMSNKMPYNNITFIDSNLNDAYNQALDDYRLWLAKKLDDVGGILAQAYCTERNKHKEVDATLIVDMEELLRKHLGGQDG